MAYCQKKVFLFTFYVVFLATSKGLTEDVQNEVTQDEVNLKSIEKDSSFIEEEGNESEQDYEGFLAGSFQKSHRKAHIQAKGPKLWDQWGKWSECSVTCGVGKITRWRHCISGGCAAGEKEAQIKTCTLPAC